MATATIDVVGIGNAIVDVLVQADDAHPVVVYPVPSTYLSIRSLPEKLLSIVTRKKFLPMTSAK